MNEETGQFVADICAMVNATLAHTRRKRELSPVSFSASRMVTTMLFESMIVVNNDYFVAQYLVAGPARNPKEFVIVDPRIRRSFTRALEEDKDVLPGEASFLYYPDNFDEVCESVIDDADTVFVGLLDIFDRRMLNNVRDYVARAMHRRSRAIDLVFLGYGS